MSNCRPTNSNESQGFNIKLRLLWQLLFNPELEIIITICIVTFIIMIFILGNSESILFN
jgi:hypothetical protein